MNIDDPAEHIKPVRMVACRLAHQLCGYAVNDSNELPEQCLTVEHSIILLLF